MLGFLPTVLAITVFGRIILLSIPKNGLIYRYLSVAVVLCVSAIVVLPVADLVVSLDNMLDIDFGELAGPEYGGYESIFEEGIADSLYPSVEEYVYVMLESEFFVMRADCDVTVEFNTRGDVIAVERITVFLKNNAILADTGKICRYFEERLNCIVDVSVDLP